MPKSREELGLRLRQREAVARLGQLALSDLSPQMLLDEARQVVGAELGADAAGALELLSDGSAFVLRAGFGRPPEQVGEEQVPGSPSSRGGYTLVSSAPVITRDAGLEAWFEFSPQVPAQGIVSGLSANIGSNDGSSGILGEHTYAARDLSEHDVAFLEAVANILAIALARQAAEKEAEQTHQMLEAVIEGTSDDVFVKDLDGRFLAVNRNAAEMIGRPREELIGRTLHEVFPQRTAETFGESDRLVLERGTVETFEETVARGEEEHVFLTTKGPYRARDGTLLGTFGIARDITVRKTQEQKLARNEERFRLAQEGARMGSWEVDLVSGLTTWSDGLRTLCGVGPDHPVGVQSIAALLHPDDRQNVIREVEEAYTNGTPFELECRIIHPGGELRWILVRSSSLRDTAGTLLRVLGVAVDITGRKQMEQELRAARDYADRLIETSNAIVLVLDRDANIVNFNRAAEEITGYTREEVVGRSWDIMLPRERYQAPWDEFARLVSEGDPGRYENPILTKSGEERIILWKNSPMHDDADEVVGTVSFGIDVTEQRSAEAERGQLETRLLQAEKLEALGQLSGGVAHDFNNLLVAIQGYGELALGRLERGEDGVADDISQVLAAADRAAALTKQLLAFGRQQVLHAEVLDLNEVVRNTDGLLQRVIGENVELVTTLTEQPVVVKADRGQLEQVIVNLVVNGRDAMPGGGRLTIEVAAAAPEAAEGGSAPPYALLSVTDEGSGIDASTASRIFDPFFTTKGDEGTGLGLATVYGIIAQSGGHVVLDTSPGSGSTFTIQLPLCSDQLTPPQAPLPATSDGGNETILVVEDDPTVRTLVSRMLATRGYDIVDAADGEQAIERFGARPHPIKLVISDLMMRGLNGRETVDRIRGIEPTTKAIFMSGYTDDAVIQSGDGLAPGTSFIQKPFSGDNLASLVRELLDQASA